MTDPARNRAAASDSPRATSPYFYLFTYRRAYALSWTITLLPPPLLRLQLTSNTLRCVLACLYRFAAHYLARCRDTRAMPRFSCHDIPNAHVGLPGPPLSLELVILLPQFAVTGIKQFTDTDWRSATGADAGCCEHLSSQFLAAQTPCLLRHFLLTQHRWTCLQHYACAYLAFYAARSPFVDDRVLDALLPPTRRISMPDAACVFAAFTSSSLPAFMTARICRWTRATMPLGNSL